MSLGRKGLVVLQWLWVKLWLCLRRVMVVVSLTMAHGGWSEGDNVGE